VGSSYTAQAPAETIHSGIALWKDAHENTDGMLFTAMLDSP